MSSRGRALGPRIVLLRKTAFQSLERTCIFCQQTRPFPQFSTSARAGREQHQHKGPFGTRLRTALRDTKIQWKYRIPVGLGIGFLGAVQLYRVQEREKKRHQEEQEEQNTLDSTEDSKGRPKKRKIIRPSGPW